VDLIYSRCRWPLSRALSGYWTELHDTTASIYFVPDIFLFDLIQAHIETIAAYPSRRCARLLLGIQRGREARQ